MQDSSGSKTGYALPRKLLDLVLAPNPDNEHRGSPLLDQVETDQILQNVPATPQGAEEGERAYLVRRLAKVGTAAIDFVTLDSHVLYKPHAHDNSDSKIFINEGVGYLLLRKEPEGEVRQPYKPGDSFFVCSGTYHGFLTESVTYFVSINDPEIRNAETGAADIRF